MNIIYSLLILNLLNYISDLFYLNKGIIIIYVLLLQNKYIIIF